MLKELLDVFLVNQHFQYKEYSKFVDVSNENFVNSIYWVGCIVHEMLHNLGHKYSDSNQWQIKLLGNFFFKLIQIFL
jgi:hypothetical protein